MAESDKPGSALEAVEAAARDVPESDSSPDDDVQASSGEDTPEQETAQTSEDASPAKEDPGDGTAPQQGPIPFDRHKSALENARAKAREEALAQWRQQYGWAEQADQQALARAQHWYNQMHENPIAFYQMLGRELESHPHLGPQLKQPAAYEPPKPTLRSEDGQLVYNAEQLQQILDHRVQSLKAEQASQLQQIQQQLQGFSQLEQQRSAMTQAQQYSASVLATARQQWPGFKDNEKAIAEAMSAMPANGQGVGEQLRDAYISVVVPKLAKSGEQKALATMQQKAAAGSVDPGAVSAGAKSRPKNEKELAGWLEKRSKRKQA